LSSFGPKHSKFIYSGRHRFSKTEVQENNYRFRIKKKHLTSRKQVER